MTAVDLAYSTDGGATYPYTIATGETNDGHFQWTVPGPASTQVKVRATAHDGDGNSADADSEGTFAITGAPQTVYDFSAGAGVDRWGWGYQTPTWTSIGRCGRRLGQQPLPLLVPERRLRNDPRLRVHHRRGPGPDPRHRDPLGGLR